VPELDRYAGYVLAAYGITWLVFGAYLLYLRSRLRGLRRQLEKQTQSDPERKVKRSRE
jgi:CcmD family protein